MNLLYILIYTICLKIYGIFLSIASLFHSKAKQWVEGRSNIFNQLKITFSKEKSPIIWIHCASLGEFEQGRPLIEKLKANKPHFKILLTFFSPSGYEIRKNYPLADFVFYLPLDSPSHAKKFIELVQPKLVFFVKYEFWYFYLKTLQEQNIPLFLIAGLFRKNQFFFKWYGKWFLPVIKGFHQIFLQDEASFKIAKKFGLNNCLTVGDPRIDRVSTIIKTKNEFPTIKSFKSDKKLMILGSTHLKDEIIFFDFIKLIKENQLTQHWKFLIAPHEIHQKNINRLKNNTLLSTTIFSNNENNENADLLILDTMGQLSATYHHADLVYIGGGFDRGIHNILEPAVYGLPIIFGPNYHSFKEAKDLTQKGGSFSIKNANGLEKIFNQFQNKDKREATGGINFNYINQNIGATEQIINYLNKKNIL